jgi:peptidoglycan/xylan/chitin deacetylase (PgdA/CDA1 family)
MGPGRAGRIGRARGRRGGRGVDSERCQPDRAQEGAVGRRGLLRIGLGAVALGAAACGGRARYAAMTTVRGRPVRPTATAVTDAPLPVLRPVTDAPLPVLKELPGVYKAPPRRIWSRPAYYMRDVVPGAPANAIALTIDDGPHPLYTPMVLEVLRRYRVKATFSMIGINVQRYPGTARQVVTEGHTICNHSMHHPIPFTWRSPASIEAEVADAMSRIWDATKTTPRLFRSPGGEWSPAVFRAIAAYDLAPLGWDVDPRDWTMPGIPHIEGVLDSGRGGDILLCHDGGGNRIQTVRALSQVIPALLARGLKFITL